VNKDSLDGRSIDPLFEPHLPRFKVHQEKTKGNEKGGVVVEVGVEVLFHANNSIKNDIVI